MIVFALWPSIQPRTSSVNQFCPVRELWSAVDSGDTASEPGRRGETPLPWLHTVPTGYTRRM